MALRHETRDQTVTRLARKAREEGVQLKRDGLGRYWATSTSAPGAMYALTGYSYSCPGFFHHGACKHHSALMVALGWVEREPETPTPAPVALPVSPPCRSCEGRGFHITARRVGRGEFVREDVPCPACHGAGQPVQVAA